MRRLIFLLFVLSTGCMSRGEVAPLLTPDRAAMPDSSAYVANGAILPGPPLPGLHFAPSEGVCAPPAGPLTFAACCGGNACNGHCIHAEGGKSACSCFGEAGGCKAGMTCSKLAHKCVKTDEVKPR